MFGGAGAYFFDDLRQFTQELSEKAKELAKKDGEASKSNDEKTAATSEDSADSKTEDEVKMSSASTVPAFDVVRIDDAGTAIFAGRAAPGAKVRVESNKELIGEAEADGNGDWIVMVDKPIKAGKHEFALVARAPGATDDLHSKEKVKFTVGDEPEAAPAKVAAASATAPSPDSLAEQSSEPEKSEDTASGEAKSSSEEAPAMETASGPEEAEETPEVAASSDQDQEEVAAATSAPSETESQSQPEQQMAAASATSAPTPSSDTDQSAEDKAEADDSQDAAVAAASEEDNSQATAIPEPPKAAEPEKSTQTAKVEVEQSMEQPIQATVAPSSESGFSTVDKDGYVIIRRGDTLWDIAKRKYGAGHRYVKIYKNNRKQISNPNLIFPEQKFDLPN